ncbi:MAG TPA: IPT/TIG domain-containing protein [Planctomycetota bacterium]|nr:IPT/TIG domain-containing protein [Planctomycetota bacterium]
MNRFAAAAAVLVALAAAGGPPAGPRAALAAGPDPTVVSVDPATASAAGGVTVTVTGTDFAAPMTVTFGGTPATSVTVTSPTTLTCVVPPHVPGAVNVVATQDTPPISTSAPLVDGFTYTPPPAYVWVPRANGSATGGNPGGLDVTVVDFVNRAVAGSIDLNPSDPDLPNDDAWRVSQILFDGTGAHAFLATQGTFGSFNSRKIFIVRTARVLGTEVGTPILSVIDTGGNPYQIALSGNGNTLYVADGSAWTPLPGNGKFRVYDVSNRSLPVEQGTGTEVGILPVLSYDRSAYGGWNTNSSFSGLIQSKANRCVVTNSFSRSIQAIDLTTRAVVDTEAVAATATGTIQLASSIPSPYSDDVVYIQVVDTTPPTPPVPDPPPPPPTRYFLYRISTGDLTDKGTVSVPIRFFTVLPAPDLSSRGAWAHPDGQSLVAIPFSDPSVATWKPASGSASARTGIQGGGPPSTLAYNDAKGFFYARENDGGWTVFEVPASSGAAPVAKISIADPTEVDSLRVVGDGSFLVGTSISSLAIVDGDDASATRHEIVGTVALPLDPRRGPSFPQPGGVGGPRTFVTVAGAASGPRIVLPLPGDDFDPDEAPPEFQVDDPNAPLRLEDHDGDPLTPEVPTDRDPRELELGTQRDFLAIPGARRVRIPMARGQLNITPPRAAWMRVLRGAAEDVARPVYARVNRISVTGLRTYGEVVRLFVAAPATPSQDLPAPDAMVTPISPPSFRFTTSGSGSYAIEFASHAGFDAGRIGRVGAGRIVDDPADPAGIAVTRVPSARAWARIAKRAANRASAANPPVFPPKILWRVRFVDRFRRVSYSPERSLTLQ